MHTTTLATVLFLAAPFALPACGSAPDGSDTTSHTTSAATLSELATLSGVGTFAIDSAVFQATFTGPVGA